MDGPIELPPEAAPFTRDNLLRTLQNAVSHNQHQIQVGTSQLQQWETRDGYFRSLQDIFMQHDLPQPVRMLCLIQLKNGIDKYWRRAANNAIKQDERDAIRSRLLESSIIEPSLNLVSMNAIVTAKIARYDFPAQWPKLVDGLQDLLNEAARSQPDKLPRVLMVTHHVVKELATMRMARSRASFYAVAPSLFKLLYSLYQAGVQSIVNNYLEGAQALNSDMLSQISVTESILKVLRRLACAGYEIPHRDQEVVSFWHSSEAFMQKFAHLVHQPDQAKATSVFPIAKQLVKLHLETASQHPVSFILLPGTADLVRLYWNSAVALRNRQISNSEEVEDVSSVYDWLNLKTLLLLRACFRIAQSSGKPAKFKSPTTDGDGVDEPAEAKQKIRNELLVDAFLIDMFRTLISTFFIYIESDLDEWTSEPEEWDIKEEGDDSAYEQSVRSCAERLFLDITIHHRELVTPPLLDSLDTMSQVQDSRPLIKDAMLSAIGVSAPILHGKLEFIPFINRYLVPDLAKTEDDRMNNVLRRRAAILLAQWIGIDVPKEHRPLVYQIYEHLLDPSVPANNQLVRITAGKRLVNIVDEWEFSSKQFEPFASKVLHRLVGLMRECSLVETKLALLHALSKIIERLGAGIKPVVGDIVQILPPLWDESGEQHLLKQSIVQVLTHLVAALKAESVALQDMVVPIVRSSLDPASGTQVYLLNDCLDLLQAVLSQTTRPLSPQLLSLVPMLLPVFELEMQYIEKALNITESYILLAPSELLQDDARQPILAGFRSLLDVKSPRVIADVCRMTELLVRAAQEFGQESAVEVVASGLLQCDCLPRMLATVLENWSAHQTTGPKRKEQTSDWKSEIHYLGILSRLVLVSPKIFFTVLSAVSGRHQLSDEALLERVLDEFFRTIEGAIDPSRTKLLGLALTKLVESGQAWILKRLQEVLSVWTSLVLEFRGDNEGPDRLRDTLVYDPPAVDGLELEQLNSAEDARRSALTYADPVHHVNFMQFVKYAFTEAVRQAGGAQRFQDDWMVNVDKEVVKAFSDLGVM